MSQCQGPEESGVLQQEIIIVIVIFKIVIFVIIIRGVRRAETIENDCYSDSHCYCQELSLSSLSDESGELKHFKNGK